MWYIVLFYEVYVGADLSYTLTYLQIQNKENITEDNVQPLDRYVFEYTSFVSVRAESVTYFEGR